MEEAPLVKIDYKFNEPALLDELRKYIDGTYQEHYAKDKYQATEVIVDAGHGIGFCLGNIWKYSKRWGKKDGKQRRDILKILHYAIILLKAIDLEEERAKVPFKPLPEFDWEDEAKRQAEGKEAAVDENGCRKEPARLVPRYPKKWSTVMPLKQ